MGLVTLGFISQVDELLILSLRFKDLPLLRFIYCLLNFQLFQKIDLISGFCLLLLRDSQYT